MDSGAADPSPVIREFDGKALHAALDAKRRAERLSWPGAAVAIWDMAPALNAARDARGEANHPISPAWPGRLVVAPWLLWESARLGGLAG